MSSKIPEDHFMWSQEPFTAPIPTINTMLQNFEKNDLMCTICSDFFDNPITLLPCHHSFCNRCIRDYCIAPACGAQRKSNKCPTCSTEIKKDLNKILITNAGLNKVVQSYKKLRKVLYDSMVEWNGSTPTTTSSTNPSLEQDDQDRRVHKRPRRCQNASDKEEKESTVIDLTDDVVKPIISLPPLNFGILPSKIKQLKLKCQENGIDDTGKSAEELTQKLQRFQQFWNSEVSRPEQTKTKEALIRQFNNEEMAKRISSYGTNSTFASQKSKGEKKKEWNEVLHQRVAYDEHESAVGEDSADFVSLLRKLKRRRLEEHARPIEQFVYNSQKYRDKWLNMDAKGTSGGGLATNVTVNDSHSQSTDVASSTAPSASLTMSSVPSAVQSVPRNLGVQENILKSTNVSVNPPFHAKRSATNEAQASISTQQVMAKPIVQNPYSRPSTIANNNSIRSLSNAMSSSNNNRQMGQMINRNGSFGNGTKAIDPSIPNQIFNPYAKKQEINQGDSAKHSQQPNLQSVPSTHAITPKLNRTPIQDTRVVSESKSLSSTNTMEPTNEQGQKLIIDFASQSSMNKTSMSINAASQGEEEWECSRCTFVNEVKAWSKTRRKCECCDFIPSSCE